VFALRGLDRGFVPLLSLVRRAAAPEARGVLRGLASDRGDEGKALRVSRYLADRHVRFSIWKERQAVEAVSLDEPEAERLASFLTAPAAPRERLRRVAARVLGR
jgi:hypothetical protein